MDRLEHTDRNGLRGSATPDNRPGPSPTRASGRLRRDAEDDLATIITEASHTPDRDQLFDRGDRMLPDQDVAEFENAWAGDDEERVKGDRDLHNDAVQDLEAASRLVGPLAGNSSIDEGALPVVGPVDLEHGAPTQDLSELDDAELRRIADALSVPGRAGLGRLQLIEAVKERRDAF